MVNTYRTLQTTFLLHDAYNSPIEAKRAEKTHFQRRKLSYTRRERRWAWRRIPFSNSESHAETPSHPCPSLLPFISAPPLLSVALFPFQTSLGVH